MIHDFNKPRLDPMSRPPLKEVPLVDDNNFELAATIMEKVSKNNSHINVVVDRLARTITVTNTLDRNGAIALARTIVNAEFSKATTDS